MTVAARTVGLSGMRSRSNGTVPFSHAHFCGWQGATTPPGSLHAAAVEEWVDHLRRAVEGRAHIRTQNPVRLGHDSESQPDIAVVHPREDYYRTGHPGPADVHLLVEIASASLTYDLSVKSPLYARHGVPELWVVEPGRRVLTRHNLPINGRYMNIHRHDSGESIELPSLPGIDIRVL